MPNFEKTKSALLYAPAAALTLLAGYEGIAGVVDGSARESVPAAVATAPDGGMPSLEPGSADGYVEEIVAAAVHAAAHHDVERIEELFAPSVRYGGLREDIRGMLDFMRGSISEFACTDVYHGATASDENGLRYEYVAACVSGVRAGNHGYEMRLAVFVDGQDAARNRGVATMSVVDTSARPGSGKPCCVNVGRLPVC